MGLLLILMGGLRQWSWVRNDWFRFLHMGAILVVVLQSLVGMICPLTTLEMWLRARAGDTTYEGSFVAQWLHALLYYTAPDWVFTLVYVVFGAAIVGAWFFVPPRCRS